MHRAPAGARRLGDFRRRLLERRQGARQFGGGDEPVADGGEVARAAARHHQPRQGAGKIGRRREPRAGVGARGDVGDEAGHRVEPAGDRGRIGERRRQSLRQQPRAGGGDGAVDGVQQRTAPLAGERAHQFEIAARGLVDGHAGAGVFVHRRRQRRAAAELRALDVSDASRGRGQLEPREHAEGFAGRHARKTRSAAARRWRRRTRRG